MKRISILVLCIIGFAAAELSEDEKAMLKPFKDECFAATNTNQEQLDKVKNKVPIEHDPVLNCFSACMFKKIGIMTEEGQLDEDLARATLSAHIPEDKLNHAFEVCKDTTGKDDCELAGNIISCFIKADALMTL